MKRALALVALVCAGLLALWWADGISSARMAHAAERRGVPEAPGQPVEAQPAEPQPSEAAPPGAPAAERQDDPPPFIFDGQSTLNVYPDGPGVQKRTHEVKGDFVPQDRLGKRYLVRGLETRLYDEEGALVETIKAERARFELELLSKNNKPLGTFRVIDGGKVALEEVTVTRHSGHPLAPLVFRAPALEAYLDTDRLLSVGDTLVTVTGTGLEAEGQGLRYEGSTGFLALERGGELRLKREGRAPIRFRTTAGGPLEIERTGPEEEGRLELRAREGGQLLSSGEQLTQVDAHTIKLLARLQGEELQLESGSAEGQVVAQRGHERYSGDSARLELNPAGEVTRVVLDQDPEARVMMADEHGVEQFVVARGAGPLTAWLEEGLQQRFLLGGPGMAEVPGLGLTIEADGRLEGAATPGLSAATLLARQGVKVRQGESRLDTQSLDALFLAGELQRVDLTCIGATRLTSRDEAGAVITVDVEREVKVDVRGEHWTVPSARGVVMHTLGARPFRATAGLVLDFDPRAGSMTLEEGMSWVGVFGEADASRAVLRGPLDGTLFGIPGSPARFRVLPQLADPADAPAKVELVTFSALEIAFNPVHLVARDQVQVRMEETGRVWAMDAGRAELILGPEVAPSEPRSFSFTASDVTRAELVEGEQTTILTAGRLLAGGWMHPVLPGQPARVEVTWAVATGGVTIDRDGPQPLHARGTRLAFQGGAGRLTADPGQRAEIWSPAAQGRDRWSFDASALVFDGDRVTVERPKMQVDAPLLPGVLLPGVELVPATIEADRMWVDRGALVFDGHVLAQGIDPEGIPLRLTAGRLRLKGTASEEGGLTLDTIDSFEARGDFIAVYGGLALVRGERLTVSPGRVVVLGDDERDATLDLGGLAMRSAFLDLDLERFLITSERGSLYASPARGGWTLDFAALQPYEVAGETLMALVAPRYAAPGEQRARADFTSIWLHADAWAAQGQTMLYGAPRQLDEAPLEPAQGMTPPPQQDLVHNVFRGLLQGDLGKFIKAMHLEGSLEVTEQGLTVARASQAYLDMQRRRGWLRDATLVARMDLTGERQSQVRVRAAEVITAADGSLRADDATLTTSTHDRPGYVVRTGELVLAPRADGTWSFSARGNRIRFASGISLPLPPLGNLVLDEGGGFVGFETESGDVRRIDNLTVGNTARMGTTIGGAWRYPVGSLGKKLGELFGFDDAKVHGDWRSEASYLSDRGVLIGTGLELRERKERRGGDTDFWFNLYAKGISDGGEDRGLLRVDEDQRDSLRTWVHGRGRYPFSRNSWIETSISTQSDPGVQAEFYQSDFQRYEERENDLHWRWADGSSYASVRVKGRVDSYRTEIEELPSVGLYGGETPVAHIGRVPILWRRSLDVAALRRLEGDLEFEDPFFDSLGQLDSHGEREVLRASTEQRLSAPIKTGLAGVVATPWIGAELSAWDEGIDESQAPTRAGLLAGFELATVLVKRTTAGFVNTLSPTISLRTDLAVEEENGLPVRFDELEDNLRGDEAAVGLRALWLHSTDPRQLDLSLRAVQRRDRGTRADEDRFELLGEYRTEVWGKPFALRSDLRFDPESKETVYGRSTAAIAPSESWLLELSHRRGRGQDGAGLFETASFDTRWTLNPKWELQLGQDINVLGSGTLRSELVLRRYGADFLFELQIENRAGEGGTSVRVNFAPMVLWKRRPLGILERR